jgi:hypothetical protein
MIEWRSRQRSMAAPWPSLLLFWAFTSVPRSIIMRATLVLVLMPDVMEYLILVLGCPIRAVLNEHASDVYLSPS